MLSTSSHAPRPSDLLDEWRRLERRLEGAAVDGVDHARLARRIDDVRARYLAATNAVARRHLRGPDGIG